LTQNKPVLSYLEKKKLLNDKEGMKEVVAEAQLKSYMNDHFIMDVESINAAASTETLKGIEIASMEQLQRSLLNNIEAINSALNSTVLNSISELGNQQLLQFLIGSMENIQGIEQLSDIELVGSLSRL
ncbi:MAG: hypothetical protein Q7V19_17345, partial [Bacteroidales bacterium]|nr:hypothetical protein [Bacteroidales bacterium]